MPIVADARRFTRLVRRRLRGRKLAVEAREATAVRGVHAPGTFDVVVHFPDPAVNVYQLRQWYEPLRRLAEQHPVCIAVRSSRVALTLLEETQFPVLFAPNIAELETWARTQPALAFLYVNQNSRNFTAMRFPEPLHVFLNHGESDKAYMVSNQVKAYDLVLVAGEAALRRLREHVYDLHRANLVPIGRPQVDVEHAGPTLPDDGRTVVLYAPTWEGDRPSNSYSSVASHGEAVVAAILATGRHRLVYRPHPRTGRVSAEVRAANGRIVRAIHAANHAHPEARHLADLDTAFGWQLAAAHVCLTDISAAAYDWAATGKPLLLARPAAPGAWVDETGIAGSVPLVDVAAAGGIVDRLDAVLAEGVDEAYAAMVRDHFGDPAPGAAMQRFLDVMHEAIEGRRAARDARSEGTAALSGVPDA